MSRQDDPAEPLNEEGQRGSRAVEVLLGEASPTSQAETQCLLVGIDRHPASHVALHTAAALATKLQARLEVVHVIDLSDFPIDPDSADWDTAAEATLNEQRRQVTLELAHFTGPWASHVRSGDPARILADTCSIRART